MATAKQALAAARRRWGKKAFVKENKTAMTAAQREQHQAHVKSLSEAIKGLDDQLKAQKLNWTEFLKAAEFCCDVDAQEPSLSQLKEAARAARLFVDTRQERDQLEEEKKRLRGQGSCKRWDAGYVGTIPGMGAYYGVECSADTLDELIEKIEPKATASEPVAN